MTYGSYQLKSSDCKINQNITNFWHFYIQTRYSHFAHWIVFWLTFGIHNVYIMFFGVIWNFSVIRSSFECGDYEFKLIKYIFLNLIRVAACQKKIFVGSEFSSEFVPNLFCSSLCKIWWQRCQLYNLTKTLLSLINSSESTFAGKKLLNSMITNFSYQFAQANFSCRLWEQVIVPLSAPCRKFRKFCHLWEFQ